MSSGFGIAVDTAEMAQTGIDRRTLAEALVKYSLKSGREFVLASGAHSTIYVDAKLTTCRAEGTRLVGKVFLDKMRELKWRPDAVGGLIIGAAPIVTAIARESLDVETRVHAFLVRKEPKRHGMQRYIEGVEQTEGLNVVIIDDVCTAGGSTADAVRASREAGMNVLGAICLVDRQAGASELLRNEYKCELHAIFTLQELLSIREASESTAHQTTGVGRPDF